MHAPKLLLAMNVAAVMFAAHAVPSACQAQPASRITAVGVYAVHSANKPAWVYPYAGQFATQGEGGAWVVVCTKELGIGTPQAATINGIPGTQLTQLLTPIVQNGYIIGYYRYWLFEHGNLNGEFVYTVRSINYGNSMTTWIYIE
jgi:hypothetical protein